MADRRKTRNKYRQYTSQRSRKKEQPHYSGIFFQAVISGTVVLAAVGISLGGAKTEALRVKIKSVINQNISQETIEAFAQKSIDVITGIKNPENNKEDKNIENKQNNKNAENKENQTEQNFKPQTEDSIFSNDDGVKK